MQIPKRHKFNNTYKILINTRYELMYYQMFRLRQKYEVEDSNKIKLKKHTNKKYMSLCYVYFPDVTLNVLI